MSKAKGQKIVIKFNKALLGDVTGNHTAFTVTGMQKNPLHTGTPELTTYTPSTVERYPLATLYEDDFTGTLDGVEVGGNGVVLINAGGDIETNIWDGTYTTQWLSGGVWQPQSGGTRTTTKVDVAAGKTYNFLGGNRCRLLWVNSSGATVSWEDNANDIPITRVAPANATGVYYYYTNADHTDASLTTLISTFEYSTPGTYTTTTPADTLPTNPRLKWTENLPTGTSITAEYAVNQDALTTPITWTSINNSDLLTIPNPATGYFLWLKYTLATTDTTVTPTLLSLWLEEAEAPPDTIILNFDTYNRFNDVEGAITVAYNQSLGTLAGTSAVASFSVPFTPLDLLKTPIDEHTISVGITDVAVNLLPVTYIDGHTDHTVSASVTGVTVNLIHVNDINP